MIGDGFKLLIVGMTCVMMFLVIMVIVIELAAKGLKPFTHLLEEKTAAPRKTAGKTAAQNQRSLAAAAVAAVHLHRNKK
ncbi:MAG: OadG family protein [Victivallaceae bacterium]|nr:OadG family protein [Victivallaceae bacterium]